MHKFNKIYRSVFFGLLFCLPVVAVAQKRVTGTVRDSLQAPVIGASVAVKGSAGGTRTDNRGQFTIDVNEGQTIVVSSVGYESLEVPVTAASSVLNLSLTQGSAILTDVVVVGYGTQRRQNLTGAVSTVSGEMLESRPLTNLGSGLQGLVPNLNINRGNGAPGQGSGFNIRGGASINAGVGEPLVLVDGVQMDPNLVNPDDVESVTVLKDAASAAIYGVRGAFGVILITTKNPKKNAPVRISYTGSYTTTRPTRMPDYMNSVDYIRLHREADRTGALTGGWTASEKYTAEDSARAVAYMNDPVNNSSVYALPGNPKYRYVGNTNWIDVLYPGWAPMTQHTVSASGGQGKTSFVASMGYLGQRGLLEIANDTYRRFNPNLKITTEAASWLDLNFRASLNHAETDRPTPASHGGMSSGWIPTDLRPAMPIYHPDGNFSGQGNYTNMVALATLNGRTKNETNDLFLTGGAVVRPFKGVRVVADYTWNTRSNFYQQHAKAYNEYGVDGVLLGVFPWSTPSRLIESITNTKYYVLNAYADYENTLGKHYVKVMVGYNQEYFNIKNDSVGVRNLIDQEKPAINQHSDPAPMVTGYERDWALTGTFFRLNYVFDRKYLLEVNGRYDGTSRYARGRRYTFVPSVSAGWRVSEERLFNPLKGAINDLKIRASYGTLGNQVNSPTNFYPYIPTMAYANINYIFGSTMGIGVSPAGLVSQNFTWEKVTTRNIGLDLSVLRSRLTASFDAYIRDTKGMLVAGEVRPALLGTPPPLQNAADLRTKGWELSLVWRERLHKDFSYDITLALSDNSSEITRFSNPNKALSTYYVGMKLNEIWGFETEGYYATDAEAAAVNNSALWGGTWLAGDIKYRDFNKDGKIDFGASTVDDPGDRRVIGNTTPRYNFGINLGFNYKGFDFAAFFQGVGKRDFMPSGSYFWPFGSGGEWDVPMTYHADYWTPENPDAYYPRLRFAADGNYRTQTKYLQNAAYVRMKNITLGYSLPANLLRLARLQRTRVYVSGENLFEITDMHEAFDPELLGATAYPLNRAMSFGLQIGL